MLGKYPVNASLIRCTENPLGVLYLALRLPTTSVDTYSASKEYNSSHVVDRLKEAVAMGHTTALEFIELTFYITHISGACLRQLRTHRIASYMVSSQHYQTVKEDNFCFPENYPDEAKAQAKACFTTYMAMLENNIPIEEARLLLPVATRYNLLFKINARSFANLMNLRLCKRNCREFYQLSNTLYQLSLEYCPEVFSLLGPDCKIGKCRQGRFSCMEGEDGNY